MCKKTSNKRLISDKLRGGDGPSDLDKNGFCKEKRSTLFKLGYSQMKFPSELLSEFIRIFKPHKLESDQYKMPYKDLSIAFLINNEFKYIVDNKGNKSTKHMEKRKDEYKTSGYEMFLIDKVDERSLIKIVEEIINYRETKDAV